MTKVASTGKPRRVRETHLRPEDIEGFILLHDQALRDGKRILGSISRNAFSLRFQDAPKPR